MKKVPVDNGAVMLAPNPDSSNDLLEWTPDCDWGFSNPKIKWPAFGSPKCDGDRCLFRQDVPLTRKMHVFPNKNLVPFFAPLAKFAKEHKVVFDGELLIENASHHGLHGAFMAHDKPLPKGTVYRIFDVITLEQWRSGGKTLPFHKRVEEYERLLRKLGHSSFLPLPQVEIKDAVSASNLFRKHVKAGWEGTMFRDPFGQYAQRRVTLASNLLWKAKKVETEDGTILEVRHQLKMREGIKRTRTASGHLETPTKNDENYEPTDLCGKILVRFESGAVGEVTFAQGVADMAERKRLWKIRKSLIGKTVECVMYPGAKDSIRSGRIVRFRPDKD